MFPTILFKRNNKFWQQNCDGEKEEVVSKNEEIPTDFSNYFNDITKGQNIKKWCISGKMSDGTIVNIIQKHQNHPSIIKIISCAEPT